jgi:hypothetical protein
VQWGWVWVGEGVAPVDVRNVCWWLCTVAELPAASCIAAARWVAVAKVGLRPEGCPGGGWCSRGRMLAQIYDGCGIFGGGCP